jgi:uncharacterized LabA/DUF88 family protein
MLLFFFWGFNIMEDCLVLVDDGFFKLVKKEFEKKTGKPKKFLQTFRNICNSENFNLRHLFVYMAPPFQSRVQTEDEKLRKSRYDQIKRMLDSKKWVIVREGRCQRIFNEKGEAEFNQKGVDSWIVADLCLFKIDFPNISKVILISSDSDFAPIIEMITKKENIEVILYTYFENNRKGNFHRSNHLIKSCTRYRKLKPEDFE